MNCPTCQHENRPAAKFCDECGTLLRRSKDSSPQQGSYADLLHQVQQLTRSLSEALEQQTATSEILRVIAGSPTDLQPVLDTLVKNAGRLCQAADTALLLVEGDQLRVAASHGYVEAEVIGFSNPIQRGWVAGRAVVDARTVHVEDLANAEADFPLGQDIAVRFGHRTALATPLLREGAPIGALFFVAGRHSSSRTRRSRCSRLLPIRPSSPLRTCDCSKNFRRATVT